METIKHNGIEYNVVSTMTPESAKAKYPLLAAEMVKTGKAAFLTLKRLNGKKLYGAVRFTNGMIWIQ